MHRPSSGSLSVSPRSLFSRPGTASSVATATSSRPPTGKAKTFRLTDPRIERTHGNSLPHSHRPHYYVRRVGENGPEKGPTAAGTSNDANEEEVLLPQLDSCVEQDFQRVLDLLKMHREREGYFSSSTSRRSKGPNGDDANDEDTKQAKSLNQNLGTPMGTNLAKPNANSAPRPPPAPIPRREVEHVDDGDNVSSPLRGADCLVVNRSSFPQPPTRAACQSSSTPLRHHHMHADLHGTESRSAKWNHVDEAADEHHTRGHEQQQHRNRYDDKKKHPPQSTTTTTNNNNNSNSNAAATGSILDIRDSEVLRVSSDDKKAFIARLNAAITVHTGFVETKRTVTVSMPMFQALHPLDYVAEAVQADLPHELRLSSKLVASGTAAAIAVADERQKGDTRAERRTGNHHVPSSSPLSHDVVDDERAAALPPPHGAHRVTIPEGRKVLIPPLHNACPIVEGTFACAPTNWDYLGASLRAKMEEVC